MVDFLKLIGTWGVTAAFLLGVPAAIYVDPDTTAGFIVVLIVGGLLGMVLATAFRGIRLLVRASPPATDGSAGDPARIDSLSGSRAPETRSSGSP